jgi:hypothetical protein
MLGPTHCNTLQQTAPYCITLHHTASHRTTPRHMAYRSAQDSCFPPSSKRLQAMPAATHCNTLQHPAPHCITQHQTWRHERYLWTKLVQRIIAAARGCGIPRHASRHRPCPDPWQHYRLRQLQCVAVCCSAACCSLLECSALQRVAACCSGVSCSGVCCSVLQWSVLQRVAVECVAACCSGECWGHEKTTVRHNFPHYDMICITYTCIYFYICIYVYMFI